MHDIPERIADVILEIEANLRTSGKWDACQPPNKLLASTQPFCIDTLTFEQWLQWIFLPRMKQILEQQQSLPTRSNIHDYAEDYFHKNDPNTASILSLIKRFDDLIAIQSGARYH